MTIRAKKRQIRQGTVRRLTGGSIVMEFVAEVTDLGAPEIAVSGIASIERISAGQVRVSYYSMRKDGAVSVLHIVWDMQAYLDTFAVHKQAMDVIARLPADGGRRDGRWREAH